MPARYRRMSRPYRRARARRIVHVTIENVLLPAMVNGDRLGQDLLSGFAALPSDAGMTALSTRWRLVPNIAPALNDNVVIGISRCRNGDFGLNVVGGLATGTPNLREWKYIEGFTMNGGLTRGGGNVIDGYIGRRTSIGEDADGYGIFITNNFVAGVQWRLWARTAVALP